MRRGTRCAVVARLAGVAISILLAAGCSTLEPFESVKARLPAENFLTIDGRCVYVERQGAGESVLFIHGFGGSTYTWKDVAPGLSESFDVIAIDLNGFGYTERPVGVEPYTLLGQAALVTGVMDALGVEQAHVVGHSYGGAIAMLLAQERPERVRRLVLVAGGRTGTGEGSGGGPGLSPHLAGLLALALEHFVLTPPNIRDFLEQSVHQTAVVTDELVDEYLTRLRVSGLGDALFALLAAGSTPGPDIAAERVALRTLIIWGRHDRIIPIRVGETLAAELPDARLEVFEDSGHLPMHEEPVRFVDAVRDFLLAE